VLLSVNGTTTFTEMNDSEKAFASELIAYWLSFVRAFDPNTYKLDKSPTWDSYQEHRARIVLQEDPEGSTEVSGSFLEHENDEESERCEFVASKAEQEQN
jgi:carboxylesterase type B